MATCSQGKEEAYGLEMCYLLKMIFKFITLKVHKCEAILQWRSCYTHDMWYVYCDMNIVYAWYVHSMIMYGGR